MFLVCNRRDFLHNYYFFFYLFAAQLLSSLLRSLIQYKYPHSYSTHKSITNGSNRFFVPHNPKTASLSLSSSLHSHSWLRLKRAIWRGKWKKEIGFVTQLGFQSNHSLLPSFHRRQLIRILNYPNKWICSSSSQHELKFTVPSLQNKDRSN